MSEQGKIENPNAAADQGAGELMDRYEKKGKVVALSNDNMDDFLGFTGLIGDGNYSDWTNGTDNNVFTGVAMVQSENKANRLIGIASEEAVFADPVARRALYKMYVNRVVNAAGDVDANQAQFVTVAGCFKQKFDLDAFKFQAKVLTKFLRAQGLAGVTNASLRQSFASAAFATTQFPRIDAAAWDKIIGIAETNAAKNGYDTSIFDHWKATRAVTTADASKIELDFAELQSEEDAIDADGIPKEETAAAQ